MILCHFISSIFKMSSYVWPAASVGTGTFISTETGNEEIFTKPKRLFIFHCKLEKMLTSLRSLFNIWVIFNGKGINFKMKLCWSSGRADLSCIKKYRTDFLLLGMQRFWYMNSCEKLREIKSDCRSCNLFRTPLCCFEICTPNNQACSFG